MSASRNDVLTPKYGPKVLQLRELIAQPVVAAFCAGGVAGAVSRTVVSPLERLKILFQIQSVGREEYKMSVGKGLMKMWKRGGLARTHEGLSIQSLRHLRLWDNMAPSYQACFATLKTMYKTEGGFLALYRGIIPTVAGVAPYVGLNFMTYELVRKHFTPEGDKNPNAGAKS
ncbi:hypothetical protein DID88_006842 [Monilinia fructigena]|uniref:Mitochondrial thiamine pyrophosphate carrier 1 n=1 Tax=Monilinia fructigena TaxID=38457 RepID=A0A395IGA8_9HELO|nr:hypothetical protein DID88_006842 [Monilinia fructigena]